MQVMQKESLKCETDMNFFYSDVLPLHAHRWKRVCYTPLVQGFFLTEFCVDLETGNLKGVSMCCCSFRGSRTLMDHLCFKLWVSSLL